MPSPPSDEAFASVLLERVSEAGDFEEAGISVLDAVLERVRFDRACLLARVQGAVRGAGSPLEADDVDALVDEAGRQGSTLASALHGGGPAVLPSDERRGEGSSLRWRGFPVSSDGENRLLLLLDADGPDGESERAVALLGPCATPLVRLAELEVLRERSGRLARDRSVGRQLLDGIPDPVLLLDSDMRVHMANDRAGELLFPGDTDSEGRGRAVQFNAFHLNVLLTDMNLAGGERPRETREITLADPRDGSDLHYEVLSSLLTRSGDDDRLALILRDITDLKGLVTELEMENLKARRQEHRAVNESRRLTAILENVAEPVLVTDTDSDIALMNREAERLFGAPADSVSGRATGTRSNVAKLTSFVNELLLHPERRRTRLLNLVDPEDEAEIPVEVASTKVLDELSEAVAVVSVLRDLSAQVEKERLAEELRELNRHLEDRIEEATRELEERNRLLEWQSRELEKASRLKSQFLASMSHELRTPINAMLGYTSLMQDRIYGQLNDEQEQALEKVNAASEHLLDLINDILDFTKIEAGKMPVTVEELRLEEVFEEIAKTIRPMIRTDDVEFRRVLGEDLPVLRTDRTKVRQVLLNLLENAIRHTSEGWVALRARRVGSGPDERARVRLEVEDTGEGISEEGQETIFEEFRQLEPSPADREGGAGLGLSISKKLVSLLGGTIDVDSELGHGTLFVIELPVDLEPGSVEEQVQRVLMTTARHEEDEPPVSTGDPSSAPGGD